MYEEAFMQRAIALSKTALDKAGTEPFGAVVVRDGRIVGEGLNHSKAHFDPTSHGEVEAMRDACRRLETMDLSGSDLYTSAEPCALCVATMAITGIGKLYYAASMADTLASLKGVPPDRRHYIDVEVMKSEAGHAVDRSRMKAEQKCAAEATAVIDAWVAR